MANIVYERLSHSIANVKTALNNIIPRFIGNTLTQGQFVEVGTDDKLKTTGFKTPYYATAEEIQQCGTKSPGTSLNIARNDHVHPNTCPDLTQASLDNEIANKWYVDSKHESYYRQHSDVLVSFDSVNTTETNLFNGTGFIGANTLSIGDMIELNAFGTLTTTNLNHTAQVRLKFNNSDVLNSSQLQLSDSTLTNDLFVNKFIIRVKAIGTNGIIQCLGYTMIHDGTGISEPKMREIVGNDILIDTTVPIGIMETYQWGSGATGGICKMSTVIIKKIQ